MANRSRVSPSVHLGHSDKQLIISDGSMYKTERSDHHVAQEYTKRHRSYKITPVKKLKAPAADFPAEPKFENPKLYQKTILSQYVDSVPEKGHTNNPRSQQQTGTAKGSGTGRTRKSGRQEDSYIDASSGEALVVMNLGSEQVTTLELGNSSASVSTISRGLLATFGFVWMSLNRRSQSPSPEAEYVDAQYEEAQLCRRHHHRCVYRLLIITCIITLR
jgi:hypothetical protein